MAKASYDVKIALLTPDWDDDIRDELADDLNRWWEQYGKNKYKDRIVYWDVI